MWFIDWIKQLLEKWSGKYKLPEKTGTEMAIVGAGQYNQYSSPESVKMLPQWRNSHGFGSIS